MYSESDSCLTALKDANYNFCTKTKNVSLDLPTLERFGSSYSHFQNFFYGGIPKALIDFLSEYYDLVKTDKDIVITSTDIQESEFKDLFDIYFRLLEKQLFEYCLFTGLDFKNYEIEKSLYCINSFDKHFYDYGEGMFDFYIYLLLGDEENRTHLNLSPFEANNFSLGPGVPLLVPNTPTSYLNCSEEIPVMMVKVKGA
jgi:hypothetical protein